MRINPEWLRSYRLIEGRQASELTRPTRLTAIGPFKQRSGQESRDDRHDHEDREEHRAYEPCLQAEVKENQFHEATCIHERSDARRGR